MSTPETPIRVVSVDDTATWRHVLTGLVREDPTLEMVGTAADGIAGVELIARERPDVVTLDIEMPRMNGHEVLVELRRRRLRPRVIMLSRLTERGARATLQALSLGAVDFVCKPAAGSAAESRRILRDELLPRIKALASPARPNRGTDHAATSRPTPPLRAVPTPPAPTPVATAPSSRPSRRGPVDAVVIGVSTGGPNALVRLIPRLPADFPCPVLIVQHMPPGFTATLAADLDRRSALEVLEGEAGMEIRRGRVIIAPGGYHMTVRSGGPTPTVGTDEDPPIEACRPAVEKLFLSAAERWGGRTLAVMLTGMGHDGQAGCTRLHDLGAPIICQSPASCVVFGMPRLPVERGQATAVLAIEDIPAELVRRAGGSAVRPLAA